MYIPVGSQIFISCIYQPPPPNFFLNENIHEVDSKEMENIHSINLIKYMLSIIKLKSISIECHIE